MRLKGHAYQGDWHPFGYQWKCTCGAKGKLWQSKKDCVEEFRAHKELVKCKLDMAETAK